METEFGIRMKALAIIVLALLLSQLCKAQTWSFSTGSGGSLVAGTASISGAPVYQQNAGIGPDNINIPVSIVHTTSSGTDTTYYDPTVSHNVNGGSNTSTVGSASWSVSILLTAGETTTMRASGGTVQIVAPFTFAHGAGNTNSTVGGNWSFTMNAAHTVTGYSSPIPLTVRQLTFTVTNTTGALGEWAIFQYFTNTTSSPTGQQFYGTWISPGGTATWNFQVGADDTYFYLPEQIDLTKLLGTVAGASGGVANATMGGFTAVTPSGTPLGYTNANTVTSLTANGATGSTGSDGGFTSVTLNGTATSGGIGGAPTSLGGATQPNATAVTSSGAGTTGPGTGGATDAGLANNAAAINTGIAAAATAINNNATSIGQAIVNQDAKGFAQLYGAVLTAGAGGGTGGSTVANDNINAATAHADSTALLTQGANAATISGDQVAALAANPGAGVAAAAGAAQASTDGGTVGSAFSVPTTTITGGAPNLTVTLPLAFGGNTIDFNPFESGRLAGVAAWIRGALAWLAIGVYAKYCWGSFARMSMLFGNIQQAKGNAVVGGTGAQATALLAAGAISVAVASALVALVGDLGGDIGFGTITAWVTGSTPGTTIPTGIAWMVDQVVPCATIIATFVGKIIWDQVSTKIFVICMAIVRYVVF